MTENNKTINAPSAEMNDAPTVFSRDESGPGNPDASVKAEPRTRPPMPPPLPFPQIPNLRQQGIGGGRHLAYLYVAGATHLKDFCQPLGLTAYKVGITSLRKPQARINALQATRYGSILMPERGSRDEAVVLRSADEWLLTQIDPAWLGRLPLPAGVSLRHGAIRMELPSHVRVEDLDQAVHRMLGRRSLKNYLSSKEGHDRMEEVGHPPGAWLHTLYDNTGEQRLSPATEIYLIRPSHDVAEIVERLCGILAHLCWQER